MLHALLIERTRGSVAHTSLAAMDKPAWRKLLGVGFAELVEATSLDGVAALASMLWFR